MALTLRQLTADYSFHKSHHKHRCALRSASGKCNISNVSCSMKSVLSARMRSRRITTRHQCVVCTVSIEWWSAGHRAYTRGSFLLACMAICGFLSKLTCLMRGRDRDHAIQSGVATQTQLEILCGGGVSSRSSLLLRS